MTEIPASKMKTVTFSVVFLGLLHLVAAVPAVEPPVFISDKVKYSVDTTDEGSKLSRRFRRGIANAGTEVGRYRLRNNLALLTLHEP